jgi:DNA-binding GntR family transcriptional regulator
MTLVKPRRAAKTPVYIRIAEELEGAVLRGDFDSGDRLPTEHALAGEYAVNRHTAGQALNHLQSKGLIYRVKGRGTFVRPGRVEYRVAEKMSFSDSVARVGMRPSKKILSVKRIGAYGRIAREMSVGVGEPLVALERISYAGEIPLVYGTKYFRESLFPGLYELLLSGGARSVRSLIKSHFGLDIYRGCSTFEIEPADEEVSRHLGMTLGSALLRVESLDTLEDGTPSEWGTSYFRGDATKVQVTLREPKKGGGH